MFFTMVVEQLKVAAFQATGSFDSQLLKLVSGESAALQAFLNGNQTAIAHLPPAARSACQHARSQLTAATEFGKCPKTTVTVDLSQ